MKHISKALPQAPSPGASPQKQKLKPSSGIKCPMCRGSGFVARDVSVGHTHFDRLWPCPNPCHAQERRARLAKLSGLELQDIELGLSDFKAGNLVTREVLENVKDFLANPTPLFYLWGGYGNGKTLLLKALVNEFNQRQVVAVYAKLTKLLWYMRQVFGNTTDEDYLTRYERLKRVPVLAVDEFDKANLTGFAQEFQFDFFDARYEAGLHGECYTIFASNSAPETLPGYFQSRIEDGRCLVVENEGADLRPHLRKK